MIDKSIYRQVFSKEDLILIYDQDKDSLEVGKFNPMRNGPYIVTHVLRNGSYELQDYEENMLDEPHNRIYLKRYYA